MTEEFRGAHRKFRSQDGRSPAAGKSSSSLGPRPSLKGRGSGNIPIVDLCRLAAFFPAT